jgi:cytoskeletal protein RodZ
VNDDLEPRDPFDETLARGLDALAPSEFDLDADAALGSMRPAFHRARARRRLAVASSALGVVAVLAVGAVVLQQQPTSHLDIQQRTHPSVSTPASTSPKPAGSTSTSRPRVVPPPSPPTSTSVPANQGSTPNSALTSTPTTPNTRGASTPTTAAPQTTTYSSAGGKAVIRFANGRMTLVSYAAAPGYTTEVHTQKPDDVELRFSNGNGEWRIRVRVQNGRVEPEITQH